jgi:hypothetical protein
MIIVKNSKVYALQKIERKLFPKILFEINEYEKK